MQSAARPSRGAPATGPASDTRNTYGTKREKESDKKCGKEAEDPFGKKLKQSPDFFPGNENGRASLEEIAVLLHRLRQVSTFVGSQPPSGLYLLRVPASRRGWSPFGRLPKSCRRFHYRCRGAGTLQTFLLQMWRCSKRCRRFIANPVVSESLQNRCQKREQTLS